MPADKPDQPDKPATEDTQQETTQQGQETKTSEGKGDSSGGKTIAEMSEEELNAAQEQFLNRFYPQPGKKPVKPATEPEATDQGSGGEAEKTKDKEVPDIRSDEERKVPKDDDKEAEPTPKKKPDVTVAKDISEFQIKRKPSPPTPSVSTEAVQGQVDDLKLSDKEKRFLAVLHQMGKMSPSEYGDIADKHARYLRKEHEYISNWLDEHPGEDYDSKAEEHEDWYRRNMVSYDPDDFEDAKDILKERKLREEIKADIERERKKTEEQQLLRDNAQRIANSAYVGIIQMASMADPEFKERLDKNGAFTSDAQAKLASDDPALWDIIREEAEPLGHLISELERFKVAPRKVDNELTVHLAETDRELPLHKELGDTIIQYEDAMLKLDPSQTARDGKRLLSVEEYNRYTSAIESDQSLSKEDKQANLKALNKDYYTLSYDEYRVALIEKYANRAKSRLEKVRKWAKSKPDKPEEKPKEQLVGKPDKELVSAKLKQSPSISSASDRSDTATKPSKQLETTADQIASRIFGGLG